MFHFLYLRVINTLSVFNNVVEVFGSIFKSYFKCFFIGSPTKKKQFQKFGRKNKWRINSLPYYFILRLFFHHGQLPNLLDGYTFPLPIYKNRRHWRRRIEQSMRNVFDHEFLQSGIYDQFNFKLDIFMPSSMLNQFSDGGINFLSVMVLISTFEDTIVYHYSIVKYLLTRVNNFSSSYKPPTSKKSVLGVFIIFSSVFENLQMSLTKPYCKSIMFIWDTGS